MPLSDTYTSYKLLHTKDTQYTYRDHIDHCLMTLAICIRYIGQYWIFNYACSFTAIFIQHFYLLYKLNESYSLKSLMV